MTAHEDHHRIAVTRELTSAAGVPLRDRCGFAASDDTVLFVYTAVLAHPGDDQAANTIGVVNALGEIELADDSYDPIDEEYEQRIVAALRPLVEQRRDAAVRGLT